MKLLFRERQQSTDYEYTTVRGSPGYRTTSWYDVGVGRVKMILQTADNEVSVRCYYLPRDEFQKGWGEEPFYEIGTTSLSYPTGRRTKADVVFAAMEEFEQTIVQRCVMLIDGSTT